jgi:hypothetical protein
VVSNDQREKLLHALGLNRGAKITRNNFAAEPDDADMAALVAAGLMRRGCDIPGGLVYYHATEAGIAAAQALAEALVPPT